LGSSGALAVAVLAFLATRGGLVLQPSDMARIACEVEINELGRPVGQQDQHASALGGLNVFRFSADGVAIEPLLLESETWTALERTMLLFDTGIARDSTPILAEQRGRSTHDVAVVRALHAIRAIAEQLIEHLRHGRSAELGPALDATWALKRGLSSGVSNARLDQLYRSAISAGARGGKVVGAGGGGFLLMCVNPSEQAAVTHAMAQLRVSPPLKFRLSMGGVEVVEPSAAGSTRRPAKRRDQLAAKAANG